jgi:hypothetical protein
MNTRSLAHDKRRDPAAVLIGLSTAKASYETMFSVEYLSNYKEYQNITNHLEEMKKKHPKLAITLFSKE